MEIVSINLSQKIDNLIAEGLLYVIYQIKLNAGYNNKKVMFQSIN